MNMHARQKTFSPLLRCIAAGVLLVWFAAQAVCFAHCQRGVTPGGLKKTSCSGSALAQASANEGGSCCPSRHKPAAGLTCVTMKSVLTGGHSTALVQPDLPLLYSLTSYAFSAMPTGTAPALARQSEARDSFLKPEVFLGPAHRSHAPPSRS